MANRRTSLVFPVVFLAVVFLASVFLGAAAPVTAGSELRPSPIAAERKIDDTIDDTAAAQMQALYRSVAIVTGTGEKNRGPGFAQCLRDVLVKTSADPTILNNPKLSKVLPPAESLIQTFGYRDLLEGKPLRDEQGSYDRPHALTVEFDPARIDAVLRALGRQTWAPPRPHLTIFVAVESMRSTFMLSSDGAEDRSADMRSALAAASERIGLTVRLPTLSELEGRGWTAKTLPDVAAGELAQVAGRDVPIVGTMVFREKALGWIVEWRLSHGGKIVRWGARGINFDAAFRNAVFGAAQILSGHGQPR
jgi:uncharacterized protein